MKRFIEGEDRSQVTLLPECLDDYIEHVFGTLKHWMGSAHFLMKTLHHVGTEVSLHVLAYNLERVMSVLGIAKTMKAMQFARA